jgi:parallel beta-helix repeat protein
MMNRISIPMLLVLIGGAAFVTAPADGQTTWYVDDDAPNDPAPGDPTISDPDEDGSAGHPFDAIQEGIDVAVNGDEVVVADGVYAGLGNKDLDFGGRIIVVRSQDGPNNCVIDCEAAGRGFYFDGGAPADAVVDGFTIINGDVTLGGGVYCQGNSSPTIANCTVSGHVAYVGAGVYCHNHCSPTIINCVISDNAVSGGGGGVCCRNFSNPTLVNCTITDNTADGHGGGIYCVDKSCPTITNCTVSDNAAQYAGGGIYCSDSTMTITNCMITENASGPYWYANIEAERNSSVTFSNCTIMRNTGWNGPSVGFRCAGSSVTITNCILWDNYAALFGLYDRSTLAVSYSDVQGGEASVWCLDPNSCTVSWGPGNIDANPSFVYADRHLLADSPCVDAGDPAGDYSGQTDIDGEARAADGRADIGVDEFLDTDADGLPDWWEQFHFGSPTAGDSWANEDNDELINLEEYARSRNPWRAPITYYVDVAGDDAWDGLAPEWDGEHGPKAVIQAAINLADHYEQDVVLVADGTYTGHSRWGLNFRGRALTLRSMNGPGNCVIDGKGVCRGFRFINGETARSVVAGFSIVNGYGGHGGAIFCRTFSSPTITNCWIAGNESVMFGGGLCSMWDSNPTLVNCTVTGNVAPSPIFGIGGGVCCYEAGATMINCTIVANEAGYRGGGVDLYGLSTPTINNSIVWDNSAGQGAQIGFCGYIVYESPVQECFPHLTASYSDVQDADPNRLAGWGAGNIDAQPLFVDPDGFDDDPNTWVDNDYHLSRGSPCIDAGDNDAVTADIADLDGDGDTSELVPFDLDGSARFVDDAGMPDAGNPPGGAPIIDIGAYEFRGETCFGDLDGNGEVGLSDLATLLSNFETTSNAVYTDGDLDRDGDVDGDDLVELLIVYGATCPVGRASELGC